MSLVFNMVGGGSGGGLTDGSALLSVTVPTGSTVTATKSGVTLQPSLLLSGADASTEVALFAFLPSQFDNVNPWTITATNVTSTASGTILITANKEYEVELSYGYYLFKSGEGLTENRAVNILLGNGTFHTVSTIPYDNGTTYVHADSLYQSNKNYGLIFYFPVAIDVTDYSSLCVDLEQTGAYSQATKWIVGVGDNVPTSWSGSGTWSARLDYSLAPTGRGTAVVPLENITGAKYIKIAPISDSASAPIGYCYNVWLE